MDLLEVQTPDSEQINALLADIEQEQVAKHFIDDMQEYMERMALEQAVSVEAKNHPFVQEFAKQAESEVREYAQSKNDAAKEQGLESGVFEAEFPNDIIGYHRRVIEMRATGAPQKDIEAMEQRARYQSAVSVIEKFYALREDAPMPQRYPVDPTTGKITDGNQEVTEMFMNGITGTSGPVETERRIHEVVNIAVIEQFAGYEHIEEVAFIEDSFANLVDGGNSYVADVDKFQMRYSYFERVIKENACSGCGEYRVGCEWCTKDEQLFLVSEPMYINGLALNEELIGAAKKDFQAEDLADLLKMQGEEIDPIELFGVKPIATDRSELLGQMLMVRREKVGSVIEYAGLLDWALSVQTGKQHYMGIEVKEDTEIRYDKIYEVTAQRLKELEGVIQKVDDRSYLLAERGTEREVAQDYMLAFEKRLALEEGKNNYELASATFSVETADKLREIKQMEEAGMSKQEIDDRMGVLQDEAEDLRGCDGDGCQLEAANADDVLRAIAAGLKPYSNGEFYRDVKAACPICGQKGILRGLNGAICLNVSCASDVVDGKVTDRYNKPDSKKDEAKDAQKEADETFNEIVDANFSEVEKKHLQDEAN